MYNDYLSDEQYLIDNHTFIYDILSFCTVLQQKFIILFHQTLMMRVTCRRRMPDYLRRRPTTTTPAFGQNDEGC